MKVRESLKFDVEIIQFRIGSEADHMTTNVVVTEQEFVVSEATMRGGPVPKLSKGIARRMYEEIKAL